MERSLQPGVVINHRIALPNLSYSRFPYVPGISLRSSLVFSQILPSILHRFSPDFHQFFPICSPDFQIFPRCSPDFSRDFQIFTDFPEIFPRFSTDVPSIFAQGAQSSAPGTRQARHTAAGSSWRRRWAQAAEASAWNDMVMINGEIPINIAMVTYPINGELPNKYSYGNHAINGCLLPLIQ